MMNRAGRPEAGDIRGRDLPQLGQQADQQGNVIRSRLDAGWSAVKSLPAGEYPAISLSLEGQGW
jgi:hypothetical protein